MKFIGQTYFSVYRPGFGGWQESSRKQNNETETYLDSLYSPERMRIRCEIFFSLTLPQLEVAASGHDVEHFILYSKEMPIEYKELLFSADRRYDFITLIEVIEGKIPNWKDEKIAEKLSQSEEVVCFYNLDDDNVLAKDYFSALTAYDDRAFAGFRVSLAAGFSAIWDGEISDIRFKRVPFNNYGLAELHAEDAICGKLISPPPSGHDTIDYKGSVVVNSQTRAYMQLRHPVQDTSAKLNRADTLNKLRRESIHLKEVSDVSAVFEDFPIVEKFYREPLIQSLVHDPHRIEGITDFVGTPITGQISVELAWHFDEQISRGNIVASLLLVNSLGEKLGNIGSIAGTSFSDKPAVGYHFFPSLGNQVQSFNLNLEEDVYLKGIRFDIRNSPQNDPVLVRLILRQFAELN